MEGVRLMIHSKLLPLKMRLQTIRHFTITLVHMGQKLLSNLSLISRNFGTDISCIISSHHFFNVNQVFNIYQDISNPGKGGRVTATASAWSNNLHHERDPESFLELAVFDLHGAHRRTTPSQSHLTAVSLRPGHLELNDTHWICSSVQPTWLWK